MAHLQKLSIPFASYKHDSHSHGRAEFKGQRTSQSLWFFLCSYSTQELSRKRPFFVIYYLRLYLQQMRLVVLGVVLACRTTLATAKGSGVY